ncbi:hypothetical protein V7S43_003265 [Phytophthora oleae]|uniref:Calmodulin n=1 Tax=Phytophthora oleae TaxID=2107226 RepID=A0ABD3G086_9STRA
MNPQHYATYNPQQQQFYGNAGSYATQSGVSSPALHAWTPPSLQEQQYYDALFVHVDEQRRNAINGQQAVAFFTRSHLDKAVLREVWSIADSQRKSELSRNEFYVAMRLISMAQRGEQVSAQRFFQLAAVQFPLPMMEGVPPPQTQTQSQAQPQAFGVSAQPQPASGSVQQSSIGAYGLTADEKSKYDIVFQQYDTDYDGFLMGAEAVALFQMSGLDRNVLRDIWTMADVTQDSKLSVQEFYVAMHLIVCISKRGLPMPPTLPRELGETAFGTSRGVSAPSAFGSQTSGLPPHNGIPVQQEPVPPPKPEGMSAFDSFSTVDDVPLPSFASSTPKSSRDNSFNHVDTAPNSHTGGFGEPTVPTPTGSLHGGFPTPTQQDVGSLSAPRAPSVTSGTGRDRTNSASSMNSMSSFNGMAPLPQPVQQLPPRSFGSNDRIQMPQAQTPVFQAPQQSYSGFGAESFGAPQPPATSEKPFMSDEEEKKVVIQLDQQNEEVVQALAGVERKQIAIAMISEKLRDLDELRHELVTLVMKREDLRSATNFTSVATGNPAKDQTRHAIERSLRGLVENQKQLIQQLQYDISRNEGELEEAVLSAKLQQKLSLESQTPLIDAASPPVSTHGSVGATNAFSPAPLSIDGSNALSSPVAAPSAPSTSAFSPDATDSSGFNAFSNFDSAPRSIASPGPSPAAAVPSASPFSPTPSPSQNAAGNDSFNAFSDFAAPASTDAVPEDASDAPGKSPFSPIPSPANACASLDSPMTPVSAEVAAPASSPAAEASPFSPFSPSPSPAATDSSAFTGFDDLNVAPSTSTAEVPGNSPFSPVPSPANTSSEQASVDFAAPSASPASDSSPFSASPSPAALETPALDAFPMYNDSATSASTTVVTENLIFSPVAADNSEANTFDDFSSAPDSTLSSDPATQDSTGNLLPSPVASAPSSGLGTFGDISAPPASTNTAPTLEKPTGNSPFSPVATDTNDFNGFGDFNAAPDSSTPSFTAEKAVESLGHSPFSPVAKDDASSSFETFGDFNSASGSAATPSEPTEAVDVSGNSPFSSVAADGSGFGAFGDFSSAPAAENTAVLAETKAETSGNSPFSPVAATDSAGFGEFGDFNTSPAPTDATKPTTTTEPTGSNGFGEFGDFSAAPSSTSEGFGDFGSFN